MYLTAIDASAGGTFSQGTGKRLLGGVSLKAGADAATAIVRETDGSGRKLAVLACAANTSTDFMPAAPVEFMGAIHVTLTGTSPTCIVYEG